MFIVRCGSSSTWYRIGIAFVTFRMHYRRTRVTTSGSCIIEMDVIREEPRARRLWISTHVQRIPELYSSLTESNGEKMWSRVVRRGILWLRRHDAMKYWGPGHRRRRRWNEQNVILILAASNDLLKCFFAATTVCSTGNRYSSSPNNTYSRIHVERT